MAHEHSLGPTCVFYEDDPDTLLADGSAPPKVRAQFFYVSSLPIDDPLSPLPPIQTDKAVKHPPQPFSVRDNAALEEAWQAFQNGRGSGKGAPRVGPKSKPIKGVFSFPEFKHGGRSQSPRSPSKEQGRRSPSVSPVVKLEYDHLPSPKGTTLKDKASASSPDKSEHPKLGTRPSPGLATESQVLLSQTSREYAITNQPLATEELRMQDSNRGKILTDLPRKTRKLSPFRRKPKGDDPHLDTAWPATPSSTEGTYGQTPPQACSNISGRPFARAPSRRNVVSLSKDGATDTLSFSDDSAESRSRSRSRLRSPNRLRSLSREKDNAKVFVPVGVSRLHLVEMPDLIMKPIYWSPINDTSTVIRATWFYKDSMQPVPADVANRLEIGYEYTRPYAESYQEELQACIDNGASAELKVVYKLWPEDVKINRPRTAPVGQRDDAASGDDSLLPLPEVQENIAMDPRENKDRMVFETHSVIFTDRRNAQILRPSLLPSERQNRRPLGSIRKGRQIGVAVVRGFDRKAWLKLHPDPKMDAKAAHAKVGAYMSQSGDATTRGQRGSCVICDNKSQAPRVSDLVLVIHGIGQKLSERVDSFHFTHAINGLRREFNVELSSESVKGNLKDTSGIMVLPVNWRLTVSFDENGKSSDPTSDGNKYQLQDITPDSLQGVRSLISDVMLDIPYYLSHHKEKMTSAVIREANRVYKLWCRNNPGFHEYGRVHLIAHSLGSVMAMEILSRQPTTLPNDLKIDSLKPSETMLEFDTTNLFCCGSPTGFFLLLNNASLVPRKGRNKPGMQGEDHAQGIAADAGYGCPALDNIYNICHRNDPISYLLNASIDKDYAASLQPATIPSVNVGVFARVGNSLRWASNSTSNPYASMASPARPQMQHMPSTVEMDTHNFTREEIAEKRMYLLNENGQLDYYLNSGGGPLEIQYLNMLSAHSSYWILQDFVRFLVVEIGREPGRQHTLPALRAVKRREFKHGNIA